MNGAKAALLMTVTLIAACSTSAPRSPEEVRADEAIAGRISAALNADPIYYFRHVDVRVHDGVAHLSGYIWSSDALFRAKQIAAGVSGVNLVVNEMELERQGELGGGHSGSQ
ncbi:MAG TPA: BON domain-containing protein [Steroidobacteraceae bacterium]|nr:BON domain-containing protein [Steroidobacteraceae bacterium]